MIYDITPVPKPRQTRADKWKQRPSVMRYRAFADECRLKIKDNDLHGANIEFHLPMPKSWSKKKKEKMEAEYHRQKPDLDNLVKALLDALNKDDSHIAELYVSKYWAFEGSISIMTIKEIEADIQDLPTRIIW